MNEPSFLVINCKDLKYLNPGDQTILEVILRKIAEGRKRDGKLTHEYIVVNKDEPYAMTVMDTVQRGEMNKP